MTTPTPAPELASAVLDRAVGRLEEVLRFAMASGDRDTPAQGAARLEQGTALIDLLREEAGAARTVEAMFAPGSTVPAAVVQILQQSYPGNVKAAQRYARLILNATTDPNQQ